LKKALAGVQCAGEENQKMRSMAQKGMRDGEPGAKANILAFTLSETGNLQKIFSRILTLYDLRFSRGKNS
jgi:hypothetical protein